MLFHSTPWKLGLNTDTKSVAVVGNAQGFVPSPEIIHQYFLKVSFDIFNPRKVIRKTFRNYRYSISRDHTNAEINPPALIAILCQCSGLVFRGQWPFLSPPLSDPLYVTASCSVDFWLNCYRSKSNMTDAEGKNLFFGFKTLQGGRLTVGCPTFHICIVVINFNIF